VGRQRRDWVCEVEEREKKKGKSYEDKEGAAKEEWRR